MIAASGRKRRKQLPAGAGVRVEAAHAPAPGEPYADLWEEIARLRAVIRQVSERASAMDRAGAVESLPELLNVLDGLGRASVRLANLLRAQRALDEEQTALALSRALDAVIKKRQ